MVDTTRHQFMCFPGATMWTHWRFISKDQFLKVLATFFARVFIDWHTDYSHLFFFKQIIIGELTQQMFKCQMNFLYQWGVPAWDIEQNTAVLRHAPSPLSS